jgi:hypothetical protein
VRKVIIIIIIIIIKLPDQAIASTPSAPRPPGAEGVRKVMGNMMLIILTEICRGLCTKYTLCSAMALMLWLDLVI